MIYDSLFYDRTIGEMDFVSSNRSPARCTGSSGSYEALVRERPEGHAMDYVHAYLVVAKEPETEPAG
jgi:hypothetical protein